MLHKKMYISTPYIVTYILYKKCVVRVNQGCTTQISKKCYWHIQGPKLIGCNTFKECFYQRNKKNKKIWGFTGQIKSFRGPHLARGPYVVHTWTINKGHLKIGLWVIYYVTDTYIFSSLTRQIMLHEFLDRFLALIPCIKRYKKRLFWVTQFRTPIVLKHLFICSRKKIKSTLTVFFAFWVHRYGQA